MPKKKTSKTASKRFRMTKGGRIKYGKPGKGHLLLCKSQKQKRHLRRKGILSHTEEKRITKLLSS